MALIHKETNVYSKVELEGKNDITVKFYSSKEKRDKEKKLQLFKETVSFWLDEKEKALEEELHLLLEEEGLWNTSLDTEDEISAFLSETLGIHSEEDFEEFLENNPTIRKRVENNNTFLAEASILREFFSSPTEESPVLSAVYEHLPNNIQAMFDIISLEEFTQALKDSSPQYAELETSFPGESFDTLVDVYNYVKDTNFIDGEQIDDL